MPKTSTARVAVLGSTGSIGCSTLDVIRELHPRLEVFGLSAHSKLEKLCRQAAEFRPSVLVATDESACASFRWPNLGDTEIQVGSEALERLAASPNVDVVVAGIVGAAGLRSTLAAVDAGKRVALANKETLVVAGALVMRRAAQAGAVILPVDSEHSAVFQAAQAGRPSEIQRIILTASGGPLREYPAEKLAEVTIDQVLDHPTWDMGPKITVDSATLMNKALEVIEARWLFDVSPDRIEVVIHPQSIVHSMVEFVDGSVLAQLSPPDMKLPIQYALTYPQRVSGPALRLDWARLRRLDFELADRERFEALALGYQVAADGGTAGAVLNAANEAAVAAFLAREIAFTDIVPACRQVLEHHNFDSQPTLDDLVQADRWARDEVARWMIA